ncbi:MAG: ABC transporter permease [Lachnospiraceae bacterium]|nr:ABC transporter permease [Lachnospiraceae bacterium]
MKRSFVSDWWKVFKFTFKQGIGVKGFKVITISVAVFCLVSAIALNFVMAISEKNESDIYNIEKCYVVNSSELKDLQPEVLTEVFKDNYPDISFEKYSGSVESLAKQIAGEAKKDDEGNVIATKDVLVEVTKDKDEEDKEKEIFMVKVYIPDNSEVTSNEAEALGEDFAVVVRQGMMNSVDIPVENQIMSLSGVELNLIDAGQEGEDSDINFILKFAVTVIIIMAMYFVLIVYGQSMQTVVSIEKSSKLMEYILTLVGPQGLLFGKITAMATIAFGQVVLWISMALAGFFVGDSLARELIYKDYGNKILQTAETMRKMDGAANAFTPGAIIVAVISICLAFLFYFMLAGLTASFISKADELQSATTVFQLFIVAGFMGGYLPSLTGNYEYEQLFRWIPFSASFMLPGDIILGNITILQSVKYLIVIVVGIGLLVYLSGKVYKAQLFERGRSFKDVIAGLMSR